HFFTVFLYLSRHPLHLHSFPTRRSSDLPDPYGYAITDEQFTINSTGSHVVERKLGNIESFPIYRMKGNISSSRTTFLTITTNGESLKINGPLASNEIL